MRRGKLHELVIQKMTVVREVVHHAVRVRRMTSGAPMYVLLKPQSS